MQIDFYYWGSMCPISEEIIHTLSRYHTKFDIQFHDITDNPDLAKSKNIFFPFLTIVSDADGEKRYYGPVSETFLQTLDSGIMPKETPYRITMGIVEKIVTVQPITKNNYFLASQCTGRSCLGCSKKVKMYQNLPDEIIGFMNTDGETLLGGAEYFPSLCVPYDIPKGEEIAFITCVYLSDETFDYKSAPLRALEQYLSKRYKKVVVISDEEGTFPNGDSKFFEKNGYHDEKVIYEDDYCRLHLFTKDLRDHVELYSNHVEEAVSVMREVAKWGRAKGFRVWLDEWLTEQELLTPEAQPENFYIGKVDEKTACAFILQWSDSEYWTDAKKGEAVYLHKFCVRREFAGRELTKSVIEAIRNLCKENGIKYIRLDTALDETAVKKVYLNAGFEIVQVIPCPNGRAMALYQLEV